MAIRVWSTLSAGADPEAGAERRIGTTGMAVLSGQADGGWGLDTWHGDPLGGAALAGGAARDLTGESSGEAAADASS
ncbi:hypothetical protein [Nonomuraea sp. NPDC005650]|uniref:hypothetical protein n=1 Tax=Nonomuraea sp. NPDC005650 TaxID=3157045 RepID=UPI0033BE5B38